MAASEKMSMEQGTKMLEEWFAKLPPLPANAREILVQLAPWVALIFGVLGVLASLAGLGLLTALSPLMVLGGGVGVATGSLVGAVLGLVSSALMLVAFPGLKARKAAGWNYSFWSEIVAVVSSVVALNLVGAVISALIGLYLLFQIKSYYR